MKARIKDLNISLDRQQNITFALDGDFRQDFMRLRGKELELTVKQWREKRSLDANAYLWALVGKIAEALAPPLPKDEVYFTMLKRYGQGGAAKIPNGEADLFKRAYKYHEVYETNPPVEGFTFFRFWVGSSSYNTKEMSLLLDGVIEDAQELGLETKTPEEIARMKDLWGKEGKCLTEQS